MSWNASDPVKEAGPQLLMHAFLQRVVNGGGHIEREHATGRDVRICRFSGWPHSARMQRFVIERKILHGSLETDIARGLEQIAGSMDTSAAQEGHLVIFDRDKKLWQDRVFHRSEVVHGKLIEGWGM